jgi:hypothetical protein
MKKKNQLLKYYKSSNDYSDIASFSPEKMRRFLSTRKGYYWLDSDDGYDWLKTSDGYDWLKTDGGWSWLGTIDGNIWLSSSYGINWMRDTDTSKEWLLTTKQGQKFYFENKNLGIFYTNEFVLNFSKFIKSFISSEKRDGFLASEEGLVWLHSIEGWEWLDTRDGYDWLKTDGGYKWLVSEHGIYWRSSHWGWKLSNDGKKFELFEKFYNYYKKNKETNETKETNIEEIIQLFISNNFKMLHKLSLNMLNSDEYFFDLFREVYYLFSDEKFDLFFSDLFCEDNIKKYVKSENGKHFLLTTNIGVNFLSNEIKKYLAVYDRPHIDGFTGYKNLFKNALKCFYKSCGNINNDDTADHNSYDNDDDDDLDYYYDDYYGESDGEFYGEFYDENYGEFYDDEEEDNFKRMWGMRLGGGFDDGDENILWIKTKDGYDFFKYVINFDVSKIKYYLNDNDNERSNSLVLQYVNLYTILNTDLGSHWINLFIKNEDNNCEHRFFNFVPKYKGYDNFSTDNHNGIFNINEWYLIMGYITSQKELINCPEYYYSGTFPSWFNSIEGKHYLMFGNFINKYKYLNKVIFTMNADDIFNYFDNNLNIFNNWFKIGKGYKWLDSNDGILWLSTSKIAANWLLSIEGHSFLSTFPKWFKTSSGIYWLNSDDGFEWLKTSRGIEFIHKNQTILNNEKIINIWLVENYKLLDFDFILRWVENTYVGIRWFIKNNDKILPQDKDKITKYFMKKSNNIKFSKNLLELLDTFQ